MNKRTLKLSEIRDHARILHGEKRFQQDQDIVRESVARFLIFGNDDKPDPDSERSCFLKELFEARQKKVKDDGFIAGRMSFNAAAQSYFGCDSKTLLGMLGINTKKDTLYSIARRFGLKGELSTNKVEDMLKSYTQYNYEAFVSSSDFNESLMRFLIPEIILEAIEVGFDEGGKWRNWIAGDLDVNDKIVTLPYIKDGDARSYKIAEGSAIPIGSFDMDQKKATLFKVGTGISMTYEVIMRVQIDLLSIFLRSATRSMNLQTAKLALDTLVDGEQLDGSQSAAVIGVDTANTWTTKDLLRAYLVLDGLGYMPNHLITGRDDSLEINLLPEMKGYAGDKTLVNINSPINNLPMMGQTLHRPPADQIILLDPSKAMVKLNWMNMLVEEEVDKRTQKKFTYISTYIGFAILERSARIIVDNSDTIGNLPIPSYMDAEYLYSLDAFTY